MEENKTSKLDLVRGLVKNLEEKDFTIYYFTPETKVPSAAVNEIYFHAKTMKEQGYKVVMITEQKTYVLPDWLKSEYSGLEHTSTEVKGLKLAPQDFVVIPEFFVNVMKTLEKTPATKIVFAQSYDYTINSLLPGMRWVDFNIKNVITTSPQLSNFIRETHGDIYDILEYQLGIPEYFNKTEFKKPVVSIVARNPSDAKKIINMFFLKHPELRWVSFNNLQSLSREQFAKELKESCACIWVDRIAGYGTTPLEAMKAGTVVIGLVPEKPSEYIKENSGIWVDNVYQIPDLLANLLKIHLEDTVDNEDGKEIVSKLLPVMEETASKYTVEKSKETLLDSYGHFINKRIKEFRIYLGEETIAEAKKELTKEVDPVNEPVNEQ